MQLLRLFPCFPNFQRAQYLDIRTLTHELIVNEQIASQYHGFAPQLRKRYNDDTDSESVACCSRLGLKDYNMHFVFNFHPALQFTNKISDTELFFLDIMLRFTDDHISTSIHYKETDPTPTFIISPHIPVIAKQSSSQILRLLCYADSDFLEKGTEMVSFFEECG